MKFLLYIMVLVVILWILWDVHVWQLSSAVPKMVIPHPQEVLHISPISRHISFEDALEYYHKFSGYYRKYYCVITPETSGYSLGMLGANP